MNKRIVSMDGENRIVRFDDGSTMSYDDFKKKVPEKVQNIIQVEEVKPISQNYFQKKRK